MPKLFFQSDIYNACYPKMQESYDYILWIHMSDNKELIEVRQINRVNC